MKRPCLRSRLGLGLAALGLMGLLGACGGGGGGGEPSAGPPAAEPPPATPLPPVTLPPVEPPVTPPPSTGSGAVPAGYTLVWADEFETDGLPDPNRWDYDTDRNPFGWYNNELQYYASHRLANSRVEGGRLIITARKEALRVAPDHGGQQFTSARLVTRGKASWTYGFVEVRAKLPCGIGTWPAIWMLGTGGRWPDDGEIDILEQTGQDKSRVLGTIHTRAYNYSNGSIDVGQGASTALPDACTAFHDYQLTWTADSIRIGVNGVPYFEFRNPKVGDTTRWPFDNPQYLILNLAIGGDLGGAVDPAFTEQRMEVEYVRVYRP